jgi:UDP-N-acetylmuramyl tripeptide synthase
MTLGELIGPDGSLPAPWRQVPIIGLTADSRAVKPGYLFAALPGSRTDGARFVADALARGAGAILMPQGAAHAFNGTPFKGTPVVEDADPRRRLALIAARFFGVQPDIAVAVTGTNGKTSVASFVRQLWEQQGLAAASLGTVGVADVNANDRETLSITSGNADGLFAQDPDTGYLRMVNAAVLLATTQAQYVLQVLAMDNGVPPRSGTRRP